MAISCSLLLLNDLSAAWFHRYGFVINPQDTVVLGSTNPFSTIVCVHPNRKLDALKSAAGVGWVSAVRMRKALRGGTLQLGSLWGKLALLAIVALRLILCLIYVVVLVVLVVLVGLCLVRVLWVLFSPPRWHPRGPGGSRPSWPCSRREPRPCARGWSPWPPPRAPRSAPSPQRNAPPW